MSSRALGYRTGIEGNLPRLPKASGQLGLPEMSASGGDSRVEGLLKALQKSGKRGVESDGFTGAAAQDLMAKSKFNSRVEDGRAGQTPSGDLMLRGWDSNDRGRTRPHSPKNEAARIEPSSGTTGVAGKVLLEEQLGGTYPANTERWGTKAGVPLSASKKKAIAQEDLAAITKGSGKSGRTARLKADGLLIADKPVDRSSRHDTGRPYVDVPSYNESTPLQHAPPPFTGPDEDFNAEKPAEARKNNKEVKKPKRKNSKKKSSKQKADTSASGLDLESFAETAPASPKPAPKSPKPSPAPTTERTKPQAPRKPTTDSTDPAETISTDDAIRMQVTGGGHAPGGRPIERAVSVHQRGPFKYELSDFALQKPLGQGAFAKVYQVKRNIDRKLFALKSMRKDRVVQMRQVEHVQNERHLMEFADNPFLVSLEATFQDSVHIYMIIEYMAGGDLFNQLRRLEHFDNDTGRFYAAEVAMALSYLHSENIIYRDLKPENVLLDAEGHIKLGDFGFAKHVDGTTRTFCGTPSYIPPEILLHRDYTHAVDWWSFGILLFEMLSGCSPFQDTTCPRTYERILQGRIQWPSPRSRYFTRDAEHLILSLLVYNPRQRLGCQDECEIRDHPWFANMDWRRIKSRKMKAPLADMMGRQRSCSSTDGVNAADGGDMPSHVELSSWRSGSWSAGQSQQYAADAFKGF